jgi:hypothetical protein
MAKMKFLAFTLAFFSPGKSGPDFLDLAKTPLQAGFLLFWCSIF